MIRCTLAEAADVRLAIYKLLGQEISVLARGPQSAGRYQVRWDGLAASAHLVTSGVYLYRLQAGRHVEMRKMLLLK